MIELPDGMMTEAISQMTNILSEMGDIIGLIVGVGLGMGALTLLVRMFIGNK